MKTTADRIIEVSDELRDTLLAKNSNYGDTAGESPILAPSLEPDVAIRVRMSDKISRLRTLLSGERDKVGESLRDTYKDLAGYCLLMMIEIDKNGELGENG